MKSLIVILIIAIPMASFFILSSASSQVIIPQSNNSGIAVVELFTSQGCHSCPAADKLLSKLVEEYDGKNVYGLSFHVDYWNYLGWNDPYSSKEFTNRQRQYAQVMGTSSIYTPQLVVNGTDEFVGSDARRARSTINKALNTTQEWNEILINKAYIDDRIKVSFTIKGSLENKLLNIAVVEKDLSNNISRGENRNKTLHHDNVVRSFNTIPVSKSGEISLIYPPEINKANTAIILYLQDKESMAVVGASIKRLN